MGWLAARAARRFAVPVPSGPGTIVPKKTPAGADSTQPGQPAAVPPWLTGLMPYLTAVIAAFLPLAAGLYLLITTAWTLLERTLLRRFLLRPPAPPPPPSGRLPRRPRPRARLPAAPGLVSARLTSARRASRQVIGAIRLPPQATRLTLALPVAALLWVGRPRAG